MSIELSRVSRVCLGLVCSTLDKQESRFTRLCGGLSRVSRV